MILNRENSTNDILSDLASRNQNWDTLESQINDILDNTINNQYIGVEWNETQDTYNRIGLISNIIFPTECLKYYPFNNIKRCNLADNKYVTAYYGEPLYTTDGSNGQCMVEFPLTYTSYDVRTEGTDKIHRWKMSQFQLEGFEVDKNFIKGREIVHKMYFSTFEGSIFDVSAGTYLLADEQVADFTVGTGDKLSSIANAKPCSGLTQDLTLPKSRILANNRGEGWGLQDDASSAFIQKLLTIMYASANSQSNVGLGVVNKASGTVNEAELTGQCADIMYGMASGTNGLVSVSFAGVENFWGNIWKWVDGINIQANNKLWLNMSNENYQSNLFSSPYQYVGDLLNVNGYPGSMLDVKYGFYPDSIGGSTSAGFTDYYYQATGSRVPHLGGGWLAGLLAGARCWSLNTSSAARDRTVGCRLICR